ncbi:MAG: class I SAM-dependent methyltransferase [Burkholderiales bacterium]
MKNPALRALLSQAAAFLLVAAVLSPALGGMNWSPPRLLLALVQGFLASIPFLRRERWWIPIQIFFPVMVLLALSLRIPSYWFLIGFLLLGIIYWNTFRTRVPLYLTGSEVAMELLGRLPEGGFEFADLGSGLGGLLAMLAKNKPCGNFFGVEVAPLPFLIGKARCMTLPNCRMAWGSYERIDLSRFDFVYAFLSPVPMPGLFEKAKREMKPGSVFVSNSFDIPGEEADETVIVGGKALYFWRM